jgi:predicted metal-dependent HD superfamily phosphohydrolase
MMEYTEILKKTSHHIDTFIQSKEELKYHNRKHIEAVVSAAAKMAAHYELDKQQYFIVMAAAWFHDIGYYLANGSNHEQRGAEAAESFLNEYGVESDTILKIKNCIMATKLPQKPNTLSEQILCDADTFHLGTEDFFEADKLLRIEQEILSKGKIDKAGWRNQTITFLENHHYHTAYCQALLGAKKKENLEKLKEKQSKKQVTVPEPLSKIRTGVNPAGELAKENIKKPVRGIETMFRVASSNHQRLSDMADSKAHIMISVNSIIISVVIGMVVRKLETTQALIVPTMLLVAGSVVAIIFSVLATRPKIPDGSFSNEQLEKKSVNLLFFGNFYKMEFNNYYNGMKQMMDDSDFLYASLIKDIHSQGIVLGHKYKLLRISYTIFMYTLVVSIIAFGITITFFE